MLCPCGCTFCWKCGQQIFNGYDHFGAASCALFDEAAIAAWEREMGAGRVRPVNAGALVQDVHRRLGIGGVAKPCPYCRAHIFRINNNNHVQCWSCTQHFCFLCRAPLKSTIGHFGTTGKKCRQHGGGP